MSDKVPNYFPSTIETIDGAFLDYVEGLNLFATTSNGFEKVPVIWASAERAYQIKNNREIRDKNGSLIPPIISVDRVSTVKDVNKKGSFQSNLSPLKDRFVHYKYLNQDKTSEFANSDSLKTKGQINFITSKKNNKQVYRFSSIRIPVYITVEYKINILTNYQSQMNEVVQPFMARTAQNYFVIKKDGHNFECFMDQNFQQESISDLNENERKYKTTINVKVLGYLIGEGKNQESPTSEETENAVEFKFTNEALIVDGVQQKPNINISQPTNVGQLASSGILTKKVFIIGDGVNEQYIIKHNMNSRDVLVIVRANFGDYDRVEVGIDYADLNHVHIDMGAIVYPNEQYAVIVMG